MDRRITAGRLTWWVIAIIHTNWVQGRGGPFRRGHQEPGRLGRPKEARPLRSAYWPSIMDPGEWKRSGDEAWKIITRGPTAKPWTLLPALGGCKKLLAARWSADVKILDALVAPLLGCRLMSPCRGQPWPPLGAPSAAIPGEGRARPSERHSSIAAASSVQPVKV